MSKKIYFIWLTISFLFLGTHSLIYEPSFVLPYLAMYLPAGYFLYKHKQLLKHKFQSWKIGNFKKFLILGYSAVLIEEIFAAMANHLDKEVFSLGLLMVRILQHWSFNIFAFTGFIVGVYFLTKWFKYTEKEIFVLAGGWGIFTERIYAVAFSNPIAFVLYVPITIFVYGVIITPAMFSITHVGKRTLHPILRYPLTYLILFIFSLIPVIIMAILRTKYPELFPPPEFIPL